jgi:hypothetical protein
VVVVEERGTPAGLLQAPRERRKERRVGLRQQEKNSCVGQPLDLNYI